MTAFHPQPIVLCYSNTFIPNLESDVKSDCFSVIPVIRDAVERIGRQSQ